MKATQSSELITLNSGALFNLMENPECHMSVNPESRVHPVKRVE